MHWLDPLHRKKFSEARVHWLANLIGCNPSAKVWDDHGTEYSRFVKFMEPLKKNIQYISRNMHTVFALLGIVVVIHWLVFPYPSGLLHWHCGNLTIAPVPAKQPWWIWMNTSCEFIMNDCITTTKQSTTKPCAYFLGYTVLQKLCSVCSATGTRTCVGIPLKLN